MTEQIFASIKDNKVINMTVGQDMSGTCDLSIQINGVTCTNVDENGVHYPVSMGCTYDPNTNTFIKGE